MKAVDLYFDGPDGPSPKTSHPNFARVCKDPLFLDGANEFGPFGSDAGADTLKALEDWFRRGRGPKKVSRFIAKVMKDWDMTLPDLRETREAEVRRWLDEEGELETFLPEIDQLVIAAAFGQYKITGAVDEDVRQLALAANAREVIATARGRETNPRWQHAKDKARADEKIRAALEKMK